MYVHVYLIKYVFKNYVISANHVGGGVYRKLITLHVLTICCCVQYYRMTISRQVLKEDILYGYRGEIN